jgi:hypothetical protein
MCPSYGNSLYYRNTKCIEIRINTPFINKIAYFRLEATLCHGDSSWNDDVGTGRNAAGGMGGELRNGF